MAVSVEEVSKLYQTQKALDHITFSVDSGTIMGILGPNGAGKTTLLKIITGYLLPTSGSVKINGHIMDPENPELKRMIGYLPENNPLYTDLYVQEYLEVSAGLYRIPNRGKRISEIIGMTGLAPEQHKKIGALSKGYRQRVGLAQALLHDPALLILDEPTSGLDPGQLVEIRQLIKNISQQKTVLISTHIMQEVEALCDKVLILNQGKAVAIDSPAGIKKRTVEPVRRFVAEWLEPISPKILNELTDLQSYERREDGKFLLSSAGTDLRPGLFHLTVKHHLTLLTLSEQESTMEKSFLELIR
ncbi:MAG: ABC transporter ATP-binding protein [Marinilabiliales bacterium]|nr:ABC transporter ATP-binding protein [Marinilabiliales bacterium]